MFSLVVAKPILMVAFGSTHCGRHQSGFLLFAPS